MPVRRQLGERKRSGRARREYRTLAVSLVLIVSFVALVIWFQVSRHQIALTTNLHASAIESAIEFPEDWIPEGEARIVGVPGHNDEEVLLYVRRLVEGSVLVTLATCRRCVHAAAKHREDNGKLICGHCNGAMPVLEAGSELSPAVDCTLIPVKSSVSGSTVNIRFQDLGDALAQLKMP